MNMKECDLKQFCSDSEMAFTIQQLIKLNELSRTQ